MKVRLFCLKKFENGVISVVPCKATYSEASDSYEFTLGDVLSKAKLNTIGSCVFDTYARARYLMHKWRDQGKELILH